MTEQHGTYTIPTRLLLTAEQRTKLEQLVRAERVDVADMVSSMVGTYLDTLPTPENAAATSADRRIDARQRRAEVARLRARRDAAGSSAPTWLNTYIKDLEAELQRLG